MRLVPQSQWRSPNDKSEFVVSWPEVLRFQRLFTFYIRMIFVDFALYSVNAFQELWQALLSPHTLALDNQRSWLCFLTHKFLSIQLFGNLPKC